MSHDRDWPPTQRHLARTLRAIVYACAAGAGLAVAVLPPPSLSAELGTGWATSLGALAFVAGLTALVASITWLWQVEWLAVVQAAGAFATYTVLQWFLVARTGDAGYAATALVLTAMTGALGGRAVDLWVFSLRTRHARESREAVA